MQSFKLKKQSGNDDVTHEALLWLVVLLFVIPALLWTLYGFVGS